ncbi:MAG: helix-turn-helix domain-containing protein, partial [Saprospiraceae bacterium]|nr:helix-turn-helix domain-containing protein [Saprospiraceae bacterium]
YCNIDEPTEKGITEYPINSILICYEWSKDGNLWIGSRDGLILFSEKKGIIKKYQAADGLLDEYITGIFSDKKGRLWLHTGKGIQLFDPLNETFSRINPIAEIPVDFGVGETSVDQDGTLFVAADKFIYSFPLDSMELDSTPSNMVLTGLQVNEQSTNLMVGYTGEMAVPYCKAVKFSHTQNTIAISYAGIHYDNPKEHLYAHRLVGLNDQWQEVGKERVARYNKLPPGKYIFEVKASNADGVWTDKPATLQITILPPWFWNNWSKALYAILGIGIILFGYQFQLNRKLAEAEALRLSELDQVKTRLYTNITHEFRTPLTVISGMTDQVLEDPKRWFREGLDMIKRNSKQLLQLVNQLLDLAKLESGSMKIQAIQDDIVPYIRYLGESFQAVAKGKEQRLYLLPTNKAILMDFDPDKIQSIIVNLLSNAIKFTPAEGTIYLMMDEVESKGRKLCQIKVGDSGPGISAEKQAHIFDRFYQVDASSTRTGEGTGIGLSLTKELVELLGGKIRLESVEGEGTTFIVEIPITNSAPEKAISDQLEGPSQVQAPFIRNLQALATPDDKTERQQILLVEDNADVLQYLSSCLSDQYQLEFALNGQQGIDKAVEQIPDIIISDVMMPEKDGFELLQTLKQDERTNHIPLILLTAKADIESKLQGLSFGADAYLAKPFHPGELEIRIQNLIEIRKRLQLRYQKSKDHEIDSTTINKPIMNEDPFLMKVRRNVERNMGDEKFGIPELCQALAISRTQLHRKLKAVTGQSTSYVVRSIRLERAKKLLVTTDLNVSEVGYAVGYTNSSHFTQDFRREFGKPPREYKKS